ncbi:Uma2 family endonuclease [Thiohalocapsa sp. ML1]|jgi:Uma2 family endonuclease|uniref:Uma2 family endonuclease n=1 Tax=Thiohalocapsa sp. ML1 TaxID=1431688 RepID=UPI00073236DB|nr:Uma2 family endonuclease [Thiohalocapsa sp. ML1]
MDKTIKRQPGPFRTEQLRSGDAYELSRGHPILREPTGGRGSRANRAGAQVLGTDPAVDAVGVDTGYALSADTLRAPDVAVGNRPDRPGWVQGAPPLAVEYADTGQDERELQLKIAELLAAGTQWVWVVRLGMPRQVEVHAPGQPLQVLRAGDELAAPGVLRNTIPVQALYDEDAANAATLRNLLQRAGYESLRAAGEAEGIDEGVLRGLRQAVISVAEAKGLALDPPQHERVEACRDHAELEQWLRGVGTAASAAVIADLFSR